MTIQIPLEFLVFPPIAILLYWLSLRGPLFFDDYLVDLAPKQYSWKRLFQWGWILRAPAHLSVRLNQEWGRMRLPGMDPMVVDRFSRQLMKLTNVGLHALCAVVVRTIAELAGFAHPFLIGLVFLAHPFAINTVAYVAGRASLLSVFFGLCGVAVILAGWPVLCLPMLFLAIASKEDAMGFALLYAVLGAWWVLPMLVAAILVAHRLGRTRNLVSVNGDVGMARIGLPTSYEQPKHLMVVLAETLSAIPEWLIGVGRSPYPGSGVPFPRGRKLVQCFLTLGILCGLTAIAPLPVFLIVFGPWIVYPFLRVPDQIMEYRNYSMIAGFALLAGLLPLFFLIIVVIDLACWTHVAARIWRKETELWEWAADHSRGERSRAHAEAGVYHKLDRNWKKAEALLHRAIELNPKMGPALDNLAWTNLDQGKVQDALYWINECVTRCPEYQQGQQSVAWMFNQLGIRAFQMKQYPVASANFARAVTIKPNDTNFRFNMALALKYEGKTAEADRLFNTFPRDAEGRALIPYNQHMIHPEMAR